MATGPQPAVDGTSSGSNGPSSPPAPRADGDRRSADQRPPDARGNGGNGSQRGGPSPAHAVGRAAPPGSQAPTQRQPAVPGTSAVGGSQLRVGRAPPPTAGRPPRARVPRERVPRQRSDARPKVVQGRRTRRVVRKIDVWTVLKMSFLFYVCVLLVFVVAGIVLWNIAQAFDVIHSVEKFMRSILDLQKFTLHPGVVLQSSLLGGGILVLLGTGANVLAALLYNLISDVVGGVQFIVLEEAVPPQPVPTQPPVDGIEGRSG
ncbi:MAG: hypothetical protein QOG44_1286 [Acidimicrobiaceae bacterium]|nr:hypothetical protein [Acidimicrobiaceae bacterium]MDQ1376209.1 hypothetical protein [Acidimicrobiaceae bacterium]